MVYITKSNFGLYLPCSKLTRDEYQKRIIDQATTIRNNSYGIIPFKIFHSSRFPPNEEGDAANCFNCYFGSSIDFWKKAMPPIRSIFRSSTVSIKSIDGINIQLIVDRIPDTILTQPTSDSRRGKVIANPTLKIWNDTFTKLGLNKDGSIVDNKKANKYLQSRYELHLHIVTATQWPGISAYVANSLYHGNNWVDSNPEWIEAMDVLMQNYNLDPNDLDNVPLYFNTYLDTQTQQLYVNRLKGIVRNIFWGDHQLRVVGKVDRRMEPSIYIDSPGTQNETVILRQSVPNLQYDSNGQLLGHQLNLTKLISSHSEMSKILSVVQKFKTPAQPDTFLGSGGNLPSSIYFGNVLSGLSRLIDDINIDVDIDVHIYLLFNHLRMKFKVYICGEEYTMFLPYNLKPQASADTVSAKSRAQFFMYVGRAKPSLILNPPEKYIEFALTQQNNTYFYVPNNEGGEAGGTSGKVLYDNVGPEWANLWTPPAFLREMIDISGTTDTEGDSIGLKLQKITINILESIDEALDIFRRTIIVPEFNDESLSLLDLVNIFRKRIDDERKAGIIDDDDPEMMAREVIDNLFKYIIPKHNSKELADAIRKDLRRHNYKSNILNGSDICLESVGFYKLTDPNTYGEINVDVPNNGYESQQPGCRLFFSMSSSPQIKDEDDQGKPANSDLESSDDKENIVFLTE